MSLHHDDNECCWTKVRVKSHTIRTFPSLQTFASPSTFPVFSSLASFLNFPHHHSPISLTYFLSLQLRPLSQIQINMKPLSVINSLLAVFVSTVLSQGTVDVKLQVNYDPGAYEIITVPYGPLTPIPTSKTPLYNAFR